MRLSKRDPDPQMKRELDALDAALRGERVDPDLADLAELAGELREARPGVTSEFGAELDAWAAEGFPAAEGPRVADGPASAEGARPGAVRSHSTQRRRSGFLAGLRARPMAPLATGAAAVVLACAVGAAVLLNEAENGTFDDAQSLESSGGGSGGAGEDLAAPDAAVSGGRGAESTIAPAAPGTTVPPGTPTEPVNPGQERKQELTASLTLSTEPDEVDDVADGVVDVVDTYRGIVVSSNVSTPGDRGRASFDLRIPAQSLQAALAELSDLASVSSRDEGVLDVTAPFISAEERFADAKAGVDALVAQLAEADSEAETAAIRAKLQQARAELASARAELAGLKQRTEFSRLSVRVLGEGDADGWSLDDAADDALSVLEDIAGAGLVALAAIVPLGGLVLLAGLGLRSYRRRSRERALDD
ncbi:MAG: DUF4349 domain-containing protein [Solirubrobacterales bacterium]